MVEKRSHEKREHHLNRRRVLATLGAASVAGLAGCGGSSDTADTATTTSDSGGSDGSDGSDGSGGSDDSDQETTMEPELGERVPTIVLEYWTGGGEPYLEDIAPVLQESIEQLGVPVEVQGKGLSKHAAEIGNDQRTHHLSLWPQVTSPSSQDWNRLVRTRTADRAGAHNGFQGPHYANCDYTHPAILQENAPCESARDELGYEAMGIISADHIISPVVQTVDWSAVHDDAVDVAGAGVRGLSDTNEWPFIKSSPTNGDTLTFNIRTTVAETSNHMILGDTLSRLFPWHTLVNSTLVTKDENNEPVNLLADSYETSDAGQTVTVELADAAFSNGDPVTASDVKFTYEYVFNNIGTFKTRATPPEGWEISVIDDATVEFSFTKAFLPLISQLWTNWAVLHEQSWVDGGALEDPENLDRAEFVNSGPFHVADFEAGQFIRLEPNEGWPGDVPDHNLVLQVHRDAQTAFQAFNTGELQILISPSSGALQQLRNTDGVTLFQGGGNRPYGTRARYPAVPTKFRAIREAIAMTYNRQEVNDLLFFGELDTEAALYSGNWCTPHPKFDENVLTKITDNVQGDPDGARQVLAAAGFGWDDDGNLRFPADADLEPLWPEGEFPTGPDGWSCLDEEGNYAGAPEGFEYPEC